MPRLFLTLLFVFASDVALAQLSADVLEETSDAVESADAAKDAEVGTADVFYAIEQKTTVFSRPDSSRPYVQLRFREPVYVLGQEGRWSRVRTDDGAQGYVRSYLISNVWLRVSKKKKTVYVYRGADLVKKVSADLGYNVFSDKEKRGSSRERDHWRTPEGAFYVVRKNPRSQFYKAFVLNYPTVEDADRGLKKGLISKREHAAIARAQARYAMPPMSTALGGMIEIHGHGTGSGMNWTQGCVAIENRHMDELWRWVQVGTPVLVEP